MQFDAHKRLKKIIAGTVLFGLAAGFMADVRLRSRRMASTPTVLASLLLLLVLFCIASLQLLGVSLPSEAGDPAGRRAAPWTGRSTGKITGWPFCDDGGFLFVPVLGSFGVPSSS